MQDRGPAAYLAEFIGTFVLVFSITAAVSGTLVPDVGASGTVVVALVHGFALFLLIQTLAIVSGAHFNPAVTVALTALRQIKPSDAAIYIAVQVAGAIVAALAVKLLFGTGGNADAVNYGAPAVSDVLHGSTSRGMLAEFIGTFFLLFAIVGVAVNPKSDQTWAALVIGLTLSLAVFIFLGLTGSSLNPARGFGPALVSGEFGGFGKFLLVYVLAPVLGGLAAAVAYFNLFVAPGRKPPGEIEPVG